MPVLSRKATVGRQGKHEAKKAKFLLPVSGGRLLFREKSKGNALLNAILTKAASHSLQTQAVLFKRKINWASILLLFGDLREQTDRQTDRRTARPMKAQGTSARLIVVNGAEWLGDNSQQVTGDSGLI